MEGVEELVDLAMYVRMALYEALTERGDVRCDIREYGDACEKGDV
jgi:hypothetical protein